MGEKYSQLQPIRVVKGDQNGYPLLGGIAGSLCPGVIYTVDWPSRLGFVGQPADNLSLPKC